MATAENHVLDPEGAEAVELARAAAVETAEDEVGDHLGARAEGDNVVTHAFATTLSGYQGWYWAVTVSHAPGFAPTVAEVVLLPGDQALRPPAWVPWSERLQPGDLSPGDLLPSPAGDPRLVPGYVLSDDPDENEVALEIGLGRVRVLSRFGRLDSAERWQLGETGPDSPMAKQSPAPCGTCGFLLSLAGSLRAGFGVCANEVTDTDGRIVSLEYGCGAHSDVVVEAAQDERGEVYDDDAIDILEPEDALAEMAVVPAADQAADTESAAVEPSADILEDLGIDLELPVVDGTDGHGAGDAGQAEHQPGRE
jgi:hypothetical protein